MAHTCHAEACGTRCKPEYLMCGRHWRMVPPHLQREVWKHYRVGQCDDMNPSREWFYAARAAINAVAVAEGLLDEYQAADRMKKYRQMIEKAFCGKPGEP